ncbi:hypothetical protein K2173_007488 [Erythroxylum novogranatense]|uniref:Uncharacterized protein n=1 Tax=Erythroxylum novogranatense TaxID=1862640 RepID=A0AAV8T7G1_9ROSI|nr:hypothetical protein K2173_007488 [Erythroxylum novogranatense]
MENWKVTEYFIDISATSEAVATVSYEAMEDLGVLLSPVLFSMFLGFGIYMYVGDVQDQHEDNKLHRGSVSGLITEADLGNE